ncbi:MAG: response regulator [Pseudobdellovibrionaceae bacterium]
MTYGLVLLFLFFFASLWFFNQCKRMRLENEKLAVEAKKMRKLQDEFLSNMSHELRTPITSLKGFTDLMDDWAHEDNLPPRYTDALSVMKRNENFLLDVVNSILNFSKLKAGIPVGIKGEKTKIRFFCNDLLAQFRMEAQQKGLYMLLDIARDVPEAVSFKAQGAKQVLINLLQNAIKFTQSGGIVLKVQKINSSLEFQVIDTGIGIEDKYQSAVFKPFNQIESAHTRKFGGTGLGLSISKMLTEQIQGHLKVESIFGKGSNFRLKIPILEEEEAKIQEVETPALLPVPAHHRKVMVVEDSPDSRLVISKFLKKLNVDLATANNGKDAVEAILSAEKSANPFDVVLMDIQMPIMDGYQATRLLRRRGFEKPILAVTSHNLQGDKEKCLEAGCTDYIPKPIDPSFFNRKLEMLLPQELMLS